MPFLPRDFLFVLSFISSGPACHTRLASPTGQAVETDCLIFHSTNNPPKGARRRQVDQRRGNTGGNKLRSPEGRPRRRSRSRPKTAAGSPNPSRGAEQSARRASPLRLFVRKETPCR